MLRLTGRLLALALALVVALPILLVVAAIEPTPLVAVQTGLDPGAIDQAREIVERNDPRRGGSTGLRTAVLSQSDLASLLRYALGQGPPAGIRIALLDGTATLTATIQIPDNPLGQYLNLALELTQVPGGILLDGLTLGRLRLSGLPALWLSRLAHRLLDRQPIYRDARDTLVAMRISPGRLTLHYRWDPSVLARVKASGAAFLLNGHDREPLLAQAACIAAFSRNGAAGRRVQTADLLGAAFGLAATRTADSADAAAENRAALVALGLYVRGVDIPRLLGVPADARYRTVPIKLRLAGRGDFAWHLLISAGVAAAAGQGLADAVGLLKELDDSRRGSGFSFTDLAADRAGVRLAASAAGPQAARVQQMLATGRSQSIFLPRIADLPEFMPEEEFIARFGGIGAPAYQRVIRTIEARITALPIHQ